MAYIHGIRVTIFRFFSFLKKRNENRNHAMVYTIMQVISFILIMSIYSTDDANHTSLSTQS